MDELNETDRRLKEAESRPKSLVKQVGPVQYTMKLQRDSNVIAELTQNRASIIQEIEDDFFKKMNDSPGSLLHQKELMQEQELMLKEFSSIFHIDIKKYNFENADEILKDLVDMLDKLEQLEEQLEEQPLYRLKYLTEVMYNSGIQEDSLEGLEGMMGTLAGSTARRSLYPTKSNGHQEILTMIPKKREEILNFIDMFPDHEFFVPELPELMPLSPPPKTVDIDTNDLYCLDGNDSVDIYAVLNTTPDPVGAKDEEDELLKKTSDAIDDIDQVRFRL